MNKPILSVCITGYNQIDLLKICLDNMIKYKGDDVEFVISDDCSTDDLKGLCESYKDNRIKYYRKDINEGHDLNIVSGFSHCLSNFVFLLRTSDYLYADKIGDVVKCVKKYPTAAYFTFSCYDNEGKPKQFYDDKVYATTNEKIEMDRLLYVHPSGSIYNLDYLDLNLIKNYINKYFDNKFGFVAHSLIRTYLACRNEAGGGICN